MNILLVGLPYLEFSPYFSAVDFPMYSLRRYLTLRLSVLAADGGV